MFVIEMLLKRLNKIGFLSLALGFSLVLLISCDKRNRLTSSNYNFSISPAATSVLRGQSVTLTAQGVTQNGSIDVNPEWSVTQGTGTLNTSIGRTVVFTSQSLGDVIISATFDGQTATSQIAVVTFQSSTRTFNVYSDAGLPTGLGLTSDIFTSTTPPANISLAESNSGYTPEGLEYQRATNAPVNSFWGVTVNATNSPGVSTDLSAYSAGFLKFSIRLGRTIVGENVQIDVVDATPTTRSIDLNFATHGFSKTTTDWQEISIPATAFAGLNFTTVTVPFAVVLDGISTPLTFDIDAVRWDTQN